VTTPVYDVIVIGAGPCGSTAAYEIAKAGYRVLLLERDSYPGENNSCGGGLGNFLQKKFDLPDALIHKRVRSVLLNLTTSQKTYTAAQPIYMSVKRTEFDRFLAERAAKAGAELRVRQTAMLYDPQYKLLRVLDRATGQTWETTAKLVVFADGARTLAWSDCGIGVNPNHEPIIGLTYELGAPDNPYDAFEFVFDEAKLPYGYYWVFPTRDTLNVGVGGPVADLGKNAKDYLLRFIAERPELRDLKAVRKTAGYIPSQLAARLHGHGVLVVGDAGGFVNPLTGGGIYLGMVSAQMAARVACEALREGRFDGAFLARYSWRIKTSPFWMGLRFFHALVRYSQNHRQRTGRNILGRIFKLYSDVGDFALRRL
jgi:digeranylgeranylglycerophospholipid reductase